MPLSVDEYEIRVRERAHQLWEEAGQPEGLSEHFWYAAQRAFEADHPEWAQLHAGDPRPVEMPDGSPVAHGDTIRPSDA
jgi:hypothetical protein